MGRELGTLLGMQEPLAIGASFRWTRDSRRLLATVDYGGTRPPPTPLYVFSATGRTGRPCDCRSEPGGSLVGAVRGGLVFARYAPPGAWEFVVART
jgi:hypothetical protein